MELFQASRQWATRPNDERFSNLQDAYKQSLSYAQSSAEKTDIDPTTLRVEAAGENGSEVALIGRGEKPALLTHWSFGQVAQRAGAPAGYLRSLPATLAAQNINYGLKARYIENENIPVEERERVNILAHANGHLIVRALTSEKYTRIWNHELLRRMQDFGSYGWVTPVPFQYSGMNTESSCPLCTDKHPVYERNGQREHRIQGVPTRCTLKGDPTIYVSDHDMFVFLVNNNFRIDEPGNPDGLGRGFFVQNSEVGASKLRVTTFLYRYLCANHICWGCEDVTELALRHVGKVRDRTSAMFDRLHIELTRYANESASDIEAKIKSAKSTIIDSDREKVIDAVFNRLKKAGEQGIGRKQLVEAQNIAIEHRDTDGDPNSIWGMAQGITRLSQASPFADVRTGMDKAAGKMLDLAF